MLRVCFAEYPQILLASLCSSVKSYNAGEYFFFLLFVISTTSPVEFLVLSKIDLATSSLKILVFPLGLNHESVNLSVKAFKL